MPLFVDACALAKRYLPEGRSSQVMKEMVNRSRRWGGLVVSTFIEPEVVSAMARYVREKPTVDQKALARQDHPKLVRTFRSEYTSTAFYRVDPSEDIIRSATVLLRDNPEWSIGAGDAVHLATAMALRVRTGDERLIFVTSDVGLYDAAKAKGFAAVNPNYHGPAEVDRLFAAPEAPS